VAESVYDLVEALSWNLKGLDETMITSGVGVKPGFEIAASRLCSEIYHLSQFVGFKCARL